ncbi:MAG: hypothetical protein M1839_005902 [Geoglossum umbratile]|nr:MAG: hypothetical protein M1839_005902 [Geoglossum umbratile]
MEQPDVPLMTQCGAVFLQQLSLIPNIPAINGGAVILARLDGLTDQMTAQGTAFTNQMTALTTTFTNQMTALTDEMRIRDTNNTARIRNGIIGGRDYPLSRLVNPRSGAVIHRFPDTPAALSSLQGQTIIGILNVLGEPFPQDADTPHLKRILRACVGLVDNS